jgi:hypothetical protein
MFKIIKSGSWSEVAGRLFPIQAAVTGNAGSPAVEWQFAGRMQRSFRLSGNAIGWQSRIMYHYLKIAATDFITSRKINSSVTISA